MDKVNRIVQQLKEYNEAYRSGTPLISDEEYDEKVEALRKIDPENEFFKQVEPETFEGKRKVKHPTPMLSTDKAYTKEQLQKFIERVEKEAEKLDITSVEFKMTPKLDGLAGRDDGIFFATRGNGEVGYEISSAFAKGIVAEGGRGQGVGEIVAVKSYFEKNLADTFEHPRNMVVGIIASDTIKEAVKEALEDGMVRFVPYNQLKNWVGISSDLLENLETIIDDLTKSTDYPMDGVVVECVDEAIKSHMGATSHHHRWQIAVKSKGEAARTIVEDVTWQVGRVGNITPVMVVKPVLLSGATIRRVSAHHAGMIKKMNIGVGAEIEIIRSGEVIPKLEKVIVASGESSIPQNCPSCEKDLSWSNDFLKCTNPLCSAQVEQFLKHWFKTLGTADWFGIKTIQKLVGAGFDTLEKIYEMSLDDFIALGFGPVQSKNLFEALSISLTHSVEDWRFIAAFGIPNLGVGDSRKLLTHMSLDTLLNVTSYEEIQGVKGFGEITSKTIVDGILSLKGTIRYMLSKGIHLSLSYSSDEGKREKSILTDKGIVFTGKMLRGKRGEMQENARRLGALVQTSVSGKTDYLVCGEKVGAVKIQKAERLGAKILSEQEYFKMIDPAGDLGSS